MSDFGSVHNGIALEGKVLDLGAEHYHLSLHLYFAVLLLWLTHSVCQAMNMPLKPHRNPSE